MFCRCCQPADNVCRIDIVQRFSGCQLAGKIMYIYFGINLSIFKIVFNKHVGVFIIIQFSSQIGAIDRM